jgi:hypothetical protein
MRGPEDSQTRQAMFSYLPLQAAEHEAHWLVSVPCRASAHWGAGSPAEMEENQKEWLILTIVYNLRPSPVKRNCATALRLARFPPIDGWRRSRDARIRPLKLITNAPVSLPTMRFVE